MDFNEENAKKELMDHIMSKMALNAIDSLSAESQKQILTESILKSLKSWSFTNKIEDHIADIALERAKELMQNKDFVGKIDKEVMQTAEESLTKVKKAIEEIFLKMFGGYKPNSEFTELIHKHFKAE